MYSYAAWRINVHISTCWFLIFHHFNHFFNSKVDKEAIWKPSWGFSTRFIGQCYQWMWRMLDKNSSACSKVPYYYPQVHQLLLVEYQSRNLLLWWQKFGRLIFFFFNISSSCQWNVNKYIRTMFSSCLFYSTIFLVKPKW